MKCRIIKDGNIVWFGSYGTTKNISTVFPAIDKNNRTAYVKSIDREFPVDITLPIATTTPYLSLYGYKADGTRTVFMSHATLNSDGTTYRKYLTGGGTNIYVSFRFDFYNVRNFDIKLDYVSEIPYGKFIEGHESYSEKHQAIVNSLTQRLSVLKGELWYNKKFGIPLFDKVKSKAVIDATILQTVNSNKEVVAVEDFESKLIHSSYSCSMTIKTIYGSSRLTI